MTGRGGRSRARAPGMTARYTVAVVFDTEAEPPVPLGVYVGADEDVIAYTPPHSDTTKHAPADYVEVVYVLVPALTDDELARRREIERMKDELRHLRRQEGDRHGND